MTTGVQSGDQDQDRAERAGRGGIGGRGGSQGEGSEQSIGRWKAEFLEAGKTALAAGKSGPSTREAQLEAQVEDLTLALGEAAVELRVQKL